MDAGAVGVLAGTMAFGGVAAGLAGCFGLRQAQRVSRTGVRVPALVKERPGRLGEKPPPVLQFVTEDDRVMEVVSPVSPDRRLPLRDGDNVLVTYDPDDPRNIVVQGRERFAVERAFIICGAAVALLATALLAVSFAAR
ncbi:DUF3592 domain-containing protein [Streptomyces gibsoniae]|uniref:DUF3592 domain-containing protein n=1 Tax=Streptomyces gibsoniae TaxID=3075529 RepID=A0ABU2U409_9ACTN|nr:DUF3592 domain-containing protein [Streptomyces sp. DSM 41699]MDT0467815.1 DUF3592 domain-containing protein [Streptomyces sp. DSM 41699]